MGAVAVLFGLAAPIASAHTGSPSAYYQTYGTLAGSGSTFGNPDIDTTGSQVRWDAWHTGNGSACPSNTTKVWMWVRPLDATGGATGSWVPSGSFDWVGIWCTTYNTATGNRVHNSRSETWSNAAVMFRMGGNNTDSSSGTLVMEAATVEPDGVIAPPQNLAITENRVTTTGTSVKLQWQAPTTGEPSQGYRVYESGNGVNGWTQVNSTTTKTYTETGLAEGDIRCWHVRARTSHRLSGMSNVVCAEAGVPGSEGTPDGEGGIIGDGADDPDSGESCGFNMFCWIKAALKWAFWPGEGTANAWADFYDTIRVRPPFSVVIGGFSYVGQFVGGLAGQLDAGTAQMCVWVPGPTDSAPNGSTSSPHCFNNVLTDLATHDNSEFLVSAIRWVLGMVIVIATILKAWRIMASAFGAGSTSDGEGIASTEDADRMQRPDVE